jgi:hypothetical protein
MQKYFGFAVFSAAVAAEKHYDLAMNLQYEDIPSEFVMEGPKAFYDCEVDIAEYSIECSNDDFTMYGEINAY